MIAVVIGNFSIVLGFLILSLPLLIRELSRPRDSVWGALIMILGLILITSNERFNGSPMIAVLLSTFLVVRLFSEVSQNRWQQLTVQEQADLRTFVRWKSSFNQIIFAFSKLGSIILEFFVLFKSKAKPSSIGKKWIRPEHNNEIAESESKQFASLEANIKENNLVQNQIVKPTSGNNPSDAS